MKKSVDSTSLKDRFKTFGYFLKVILIAYLANSLRSILLKCGTAAATAAATAICLLLIFAYQLGAVGLMAIEVVFAMLANEWVNIICGMSAVGGLIVLVILIAGIILCWKLSANGDSDPESYKKYIFDEPAVYDILKKYNSDCKRRGQYRNCIKPKRTVYWVSPKKGIVAIEPVISVVDRHLKIGYYIVNYNNRDEPIEFKSFYYSNYGDAPIVQEQPLKKYTIPAKGYIETTNPFPFICTLGEMRNLHEIMGYTMEIHLIINGVTVVTLIYNVETMRFENRDIEKYIIRI